MNRVVALSALFALVGLALGCQEEATLTDLEVTPVFSVERVDVCHNLGNGGYELIAIAPAALDAHLQHGDAQPGQPVPEMEGWVFDDLCEPQEASQSLCPCFDGATLDAIAWASQSCIEFQNEPGIWVRLAYTGGGPFGTSTIEAVSFGLGAECSLSGGETVTELTPEQISACDAVVTGKALDLGFSGEDGQFRLESGGVTEGTCTQSWY